MPDARTHVFVESQPAGQPVEPGRVNRGERGDDFYGVCRRKIAEFTLELNDRALALGVFDSAGFVSFGGFRRCRVKFCRKLGTVSRDAQATYAAKLITAHQPAKGGKTEVRR